MTALCLRKLCVYNIRPTKFEQNSAQFWQEIMNRMKWVFTLDKVRGTFLRLQIILSEFATFWLHNRELR